MNRYIRYSVSIISLLIFVLVLNSCKKFFNPKEELQVPESLLYKDWYDYRSIDMGLYGLQQKLVEQLLIMGELRGDLLTITPNADADMVEVYNFSVSKNNKYAAPTNFFKLISACNRFIQMLKTKHPEILDPKSPITNYDRLYGEALCMRAWAYFYAVRIYGKVPLIPESLTSIQEIQSFINSPGPYIDSVNITFAPDGYHNDTVYSQQPVTLTKQLYDRDMVINYFTAQLEKEVRAVGVNEHINNYDETWDVTNWNAYAMHTLLGQMYFTLGNLVKAHDNFQQVMVNSSTNNQYQIDGTFANLSWRNIFTGIDIREHIFTIWFNKSNNQQNQFQTFFWPIAPYKYMLKPSDVAILLWENVWRNQVINDNLLNPSLSQMVFAGIPGDFYRGHGSSFIYWSPSSRNTIDWIQMLQLRARGDDRGANAILNDAEPIVYKYSINKSIYDEDANFCLYRAAGVHLWMAELYTNWAYNKQGHITTDRIQVLGIVNDGSYFSQSSTRPQVGVRGRVGLIGGIDGLRLANIIYSHNPYTNRITGYIDLSGNEIASQQWLEEQVLAERGRELAFEGERFYDLMRIAERRNDPSFLARIVSAKYPEGKRQQIYNLLLNKDNWYINYFN